MREYLNSTEIGAQGQLTLPASAYLSEDILEAEWDKLFQNEWLCVARNEDLPNPGSFLTRQIGQESIILVRGQRDEIHAHFNLCRHRGTRLCEAVSGQLGRSIQCPYHAWTYSLAGDLIGVPDEAQLQAFDRRNFGLHSAACQSWGGFVWLNLARKPTSFDAHFQAIAGRCEPWCLEHLRRLGKRQYHVQANWKLIVQNYSECYHCSPVHPSLVKLTPPLSGGNDLIEGPIQGGYMDILPPNRSLTIDGQPCGLLVGALSPEQQKRVYYYVLFPQMMIALLPDYVMVHTLWPQSTSQTIVECEWLFHPSMAGQPHPENTGADLHLNPDHGIDFWDKINLEDWHVSELTQLGVQSSRYTPGPYSNREAMSAAMDRYYLQRMQAAE